MNRPTIPYFQKLFAQWLSTEGRVVEGEEKGRGLGATIHQLLILSYVFFGDSEEIFMRTYLELRGTLLKMQRDHDNGKTMETILADSDRPAPDGFRLTSFTPYMNVLALYLDFLKTTQPKEKIFTLEEKHKKPEGLKSGK